MPGMSATTAAFPESSHALLLSGGRRLPGRRRPAGWAQSPQMPGGRAIIQDSDCDREHLIPDPKRPSRRAFTMPMREAHARGTVAIQWPVEGSLTSSALLVSLRSPFTIALKVIGITGLWSSR
jgi:hypothetical protein